jgi:hypothetical protein
VEETFSLVTLQTFPCNNDSILRHDKDILQELLLETDSVEAGSSDGEKDIDIDIDSNTEHNKDSAVACGSHIYV